MTCSPTRPIRPQLILIDARCAGNANVAPAPSQPAPPTASPPSGQLRLSGPAVRAASSTRPGDSAHAGCGLSALGWRRADRRRMRTLLGCGYLSAVSAPPAYVEGLVPFVHVRDVMRSTSFYEQFGFEVHNTHEEGGRRVWCWRRPPSGGRRSALNPSRDARVAQHESVFVELDVGGELARREADQTVAQRLVTLLRSADLE
jgi:hypothetical protein